MLSTEIQLDVRFSEVDAMHIVWHGHYLQYLEAGREAFGRRYGLGYEALTRTGYGAPIVELEISYKQSLRYGDAVLVETRYVPTAAAKICLQYRLRHARTGRTVCTARTTQVFIDSDQQLQLLAPPCYVQWRQQWLSIPEPAL